MDKVQQRLVVVIVNTFCFSIINRLTFIILIRLMEQECGTEFASFSDIATLEAVTEQFDSWRKVADAELFGNHFARYKMTLKN